MIAYSRINDTFSEYLVSVLKTKIVIVNLTPPLRIYHRYIFQNGNIFSKKIHYDELSEQVCECFCDSSARIFIKAGWLSD